MLAMGGPIAWPDFSSQKIRLRIKIISVISESSSDQRKRARDPFMGYGKQPPSMSTG
jgi:hypothetical protein